MNEKITASEAVAHLLPNLYLEKLELIVAGDAMARELAAMHRDQPGFEFPCEKAWREARELK